MPEPLYRIEYSIQRADSDDDEFVEIGFGSSGSWDNINAAEHAMGSYIGNRQWETEPGMPDPGSVDA